MNRTEQCKYFCWADEVSSGGGGGNTNQGGWRGGRGGVSGAGFRGGGGGNSVMICSRCKQSGHFARNCPSKEP